MEKDNRLYYIICVTEYVSGCGIRYQMLTNKHYQHYINRDGNIRYKEVIGDVYLVDERKSPYYCDYSKSYYKFDTFKDAMDKAIELVRNGILPNLGISKEVAKYNKGRIISILQRPMGDIIGYRYAEYLEKNKDNKDIKKPRFKNDDIVYLTNIEDGDIIYKTKVCDCELNENGEWQYYTTYWTEYPYTNVKSEKEFMEHYEVKPSGNGYYYGQRCRIVER